MKKKSKAGFTLIEAVVTMSIIAILSAIALPSYVEYIKKGRRADAKTGLLSLQMAQEKFRANCPNYATAIGNATDCAGGTVQGSSSSPDGHYTVSIATANDKDVLYQLKATRVSGGKQSDDKCGDFVITQKSSTLDRDVENAYTGYDKYACWGVEKKINK